MPASFLSRSAVVGARCGRHLCCAEVKNAFDRWRWLRRLCLAVLSRRDQLFAYQPFAIEVFVYVGLFVFSFIICCHRFSFFVNVPTAKVSFIKILFFHMSYVCTSSGGQFMKFELI